MLETGRRLVEDPQVMKEQLKAIPGLVRAYGGLLDFGRRLRMRWWRLDLVREPKIRSYLASHPVRRLQIGTGPMHLDGWLNVDVVPVDARTVYMDATRPFPLPDGVFDGVFSEHMIEHVSLDQARSVVREAFRVMRPGGRIRIATPHLGRLLDLQDRRRVIRPRRRTCSRPVRGTCPMRPRRPPGT